MGHPTLNNRRMHNILILVYKALNGLAPQYIRNLFTYRSCSINLRGEDLLTIPNVNTTAHDLHSITYYGSKLWNSLTNSIRTLPTLRAFKSAIADLEFNSDSGLFVSSLDLSYYYYL
jgi:hypothetical protein